MTEAQCRAAIRTAKITTWTGLGLAVGGGIVTVLVARDVNSYPDTGLGNIVKRGTGKVAMTLTGAIAIVGLITLFVGDNNRLKNSTRLSQFGSRLSISPIILKNLDGSHLGFSLIVRL